MKRILSLIAVAVFALAPLVSAVDTSRTTKTYGTDGGDKFVVANGGTLLVEAGGTVSLPITEKFKSIVHCELPTGLAATGATGDTNRLFTAGSVFEYHIKGAGQTITCPTLAATGIDIALDEVSTEGIEITSGIATLQAPYAFTIGGAAFQFCATLTINDASGASNLFVGFRKAEAYQADETGYADYALIGTSGTSNPNTIQITSELNGAAATVTDTTMTWADAASKTLCSKVSAAGVVTYTINGAAPTVTAAYTFDDTDIVIPTIYFLHGADVAETVTLQSFDAGLQ